MVLHQRLFYVLLALIPVQLGYHFWPSWTLVLGRRIDYLSPTLYLTDIVIIMVLLSWQWKSASQWFRYLLFFIIYIIINLYFAQNKFVALYSWIKVFEYVMLGYYIYSTKPTINISRYYISIGIYYSSIIGILQFILQHSIGGPFWLLGERAFDIQTPGIAMLSSPYLLRTYSLFPHPNVFGGYLALFLPMLFVNIKNKYYAFVFVLGFIALILTFSRSAWLVCAIGIYLVKKKKSRIIFTLLLLIVFFWWFPGFTDETIQRRLLLQDTAIAIWESKPWLGVGLGNFLIALPDFHTNRDLFFLQPVHNIYFLLLAEIGIIGAVPVLLFVIRRMSIPLMLILVLGIVDHYLLTLQQGQLLTTIGISMVYFYDEL